MPTVFFALALWFLLGSGSAAPEIPETPPIAPGDVSAEPLRRILTDPPRVEIGGYAQRCSDCHALFESPPEPVGALRQHENVVLDHGLNDRCLNCHSTRDRDRLVLHGEREIGYDDVVQLCAKCHGPTFRDWERGIHGKTLGSWDVGSPELRRLVCTECHDPHAPAFSSIPPLPGPRTLRMGDQDHHAPEPAPEDQNPLVRWLRADHETPSEDPR